MNTLLEMHGASNGSDHNLQPLADVAAAAAAEVLAGTPQTNSNTLNLKDAKLDLPRSSGPPADIFETDSSSIRTATSTAIPNFTSNSGKSNYIHIILMPDNHVYTVQYVLRVFLI